MPDIIDVKRAIIEVLKSDETLRGLLGKDGRNDYPIYHAFIQHRIHRPCITVEDVTDKAENAGLNDAFYGDKRYQWQHAVIQIDCWSSKNPNERDKLQVAVQKCLLKNQDLLREKGIIYMQEPLVFPLDEVNVKPPLWRKCLRYHVFYILEAS